MKRITPLIVFVLGVFMISGVLGYNYREVTQHTNITVTRELVAYMNYSLPMNTEKYGSLILETNESFDLFGSQYRIIGAWNRGLGSRHYQNGTNHHFPLNLRDEDGHQYLIIGYRVMPTHRSETLVGYNFFMDLDEEYLYNQPYYSINYSDLFMPIYSNYNYSGENPILVNRSKGDKEILTVYFIKRELPNGWVNESKGSFKIFGQKENVERTKRILENLTFMPEMFKRLTGEYDLETSNIIIADIEDENIDVAGRAHGSNIILLDKDIFLENNSDIRIAATIIHEYAHLIGDNFFKGGFSDAAWADEGLSVFSEIVAYKEYWGIDSYWVEEIEGKNYYFQNENLFTMEELRDIYNKDFEYVYPKTQNGTYNFYNHAGLVFYNFYLENGVEGTQKLYSMIRNLNPTDVDCDNCSTEHVLNTMNKISGKQKEEMLFPYKGSETFEVDVKGLVRLNLTEEEIQKVFDERSGNAVVEKAVEPIPYEKKDKELVSRKAIVIIAAGIIGIILIILLFGAKKPNRKKR